MEKVRLDTLLVRRGVAESREKARALVMAGDVIVDGQTVDRPSALIVANADLALRKALPFVSRGGLKLQHALQEFQLDVDGLVFMDVGASTGGFTDCLLQNGAQRVYAIDVGYGQLSWRLRCDPRVVVLDRTNIRHLSSLPEQPDAAVIDVSFISLRLVLPKVVALTKPHSTIIALIKPQFEAGRGKVGKGGVVRDPAVLRQVLEDVLRWAAENGLGVCGLTVSPILGPAGNREYLAYFRKRNHESLPAGCTDEKRLGALIDTALGTAISRGGPSGFDDTTRGAQLALNTISPYAISA